MVVLIMADPYIAARERQAPQECLTLRGRREEAVKLRRKDHTLDSQAMAPRGALQGFEMRDNRQEVDGEIPVTPALVKVDSVPELEPGRGWELRRAPNPPAYWHHEVDAKPVLVRAMRSKPSPAWPSRFTVHEAKLRPRAGQFPVGLKHGGADTAVNRGPTQKSAKARIASKVGASGGEALAVL